MAENLQTTKLNDGTEIQMVPDFHNIIKNRYAWNEQKKPGFCVYIFPSYTFENWKKCKKDLGFLYNGSAVLTGKLAPQGWHVPSDAEWNVLTTFLGGENVAGGALKMTTSTSLQWGKWIDPNTGATNTSGFSALAGGNRADDGDCGDVGISGEWWSSTEEDAHSFFAGTYACLWARRIMCNNTAVFREKRTFQYGFSVRCIKD